MATRYTLSGTVKFSSEKVEMALKEAKFKRSMNISIRNALKSKIQKKDY